MVTTTKAVVYLGNYSTELDSVDGNNIIENTALLANTSHTSATGASLTTMVFDDSNNSGNLNSTDTSYPDNFTYTLNGVSYTQQADVIASATVVDYISPTGQTISNNSILIQMENGDVFLEPSPHSFSGTNGTNQEFPSGFELETVKINSINQNTTHHMGYIQRDTSWGNIKMTGAADGVVDGENTSEVMNLGYNDAGQATNGGGDIIDGADGNNDSIRGNGGDDTIYGGLGKDTIDGGTGHDSIDGGNGDDSIIGGTGNDTVDGGAGKDTINTGDGNDLVRNTSNGQLDSSVDVISTGAGRDTVEASFGADSANGGDGWDTYDASGINFAQEIDLTAGTNIIHDTGSGDITQSVVNFEGVKTGGGNDTITGTSADNLIDSGANHDLIVGGAGDDTILGGDGRDTITGGSGADSINAGSGDDIIDLNATEGNFSETWNDTVVAGDGNDFVNGGFGADSLDGGAGIDTYSQALRGEAVTINLGAGTADVGGKTQVVKNFENAIGGLGDDSITGSNADNVLSGGDGNDTILGLGGDDTLFGGDGDDSLRGGNGADCLEGGSGDNTLTGGGGNDEFKFTKGEDLTITDFYAGAQDPANTNADNLDTLDLTKYYTNVQELKEDLADDGILNQSAGDYSDNESMNGGSVTGLSFLKNRSAKQISKALGLPCFVRGTFIATMGGLVAVEDLKPGDKVITRDNGLQEIRWIGSKEVAATGKFAPIRFKAGALGHGETDLWLSPNHRILKTGWEVDMLLDTSEVLISAKHLVGRPGIEQISGGSVEYFHILFDQHEVILSNGAWSESFHPGQEGMDAFSEETCEEVLQLFPELSAEDGYESYGSTARMVLKSHEVDLLQLSGGL